MRAWEVLPLPEVKRNAFKAVEPVPPVRTPLASALVADKKKAARKAKAARDRLLSQ